MKKVVGVVVAIIVIAVIIILVASGKSNAPQNTAATNTPSPATSTSPAPTNNIIISSFAFGPANITVTKGTTVTWTNKDTVAHTVTESDGKTGPKSGDLNQNQTYSFTFNQVGTFKYDCSIHPYMTGTVTVNE